MWLRNEMIVIGHQAISHDRGCWPIDFRSFENFGSLRPFAQEIATQTTEKEPLTSVFKKYQTTIIATIVNMIILTSKMLHTTSKEILRRFYAQVTYIFVLQPSQGSFDN